MRLFLLTLLCLLLIVTQCYSISTMDELEALMDDFFQEQDQSSTKDEKVFVTNAQECGK